MAKKKIPLEEQILAVDREMEQTRERLKELSKRRETLALEKQQQELKRLSDYMKEQHISMEDVFQKLTQGNA